MTESIPNISNDLDKLVETLRVVQDHLKDGVEKETETATDDLAVFWNTSEAAVKLVSIEATKLCLAFAEPPLPKYEVYHPLIERIGKATLAMVTSFYNLPLSKGATLNRMVRKDISRIVDATVTLVEVIKASNYQGSQQHLHSTGTVWEYCDQFPNLPKDNKDATLHVGNETSQLVKDALEEIQETLQSEDGCGDQLDLSCQDQNDVSWSEEDKQVIMPSVGLIKAANACLKRVLGAVKKHGKCDCAKDASQLDNLVERLYEVSPAVDEVVLSVYPPVNKEVVHENTEKLGVILQTLLECVKHVHVTTEDDASWLEFLLKAVIHNMDKMQQVTS
ncbi:cyclin-D1-binding protein 1 [Lamellibrachia satsuma]|nr:cyclin-D1-binding protein 1 [Lamellibrachia satsuma]